MGETTLRREEGHWTGAFTAMASPCQVLREVDDRRDAARILAAVASEVRRIEAKYSRYLPGNIVHRINHSQGRPVEVDAETARLLDYAARLHALSEGKFDVTSGVLRRVWRFDGSDRVPAPDEVERVRALVGWGQVRWDGSAVQLAPEMEIDFGGIGKEYAADRAAALLPEHCLVNLGGDLLATGPRRGGRPWRVGVESPDVPVPQARHLLDLHAGALATSGDSKRFLLKDGVRYGHILDPTTGWPVRGAPRSVTVAAGTCLDAGMLTTFAMLQGPGAEAFLEAQGVRHWILR
ncbi:MAG TPA: FAD:protein FMN transferase [Candidatus Polarisedimenticolaceae bacterium]|nr:FAD:protein FMN transferase [Candidatus Polarisedimenticolaceae bacterium]